jgi:hypothetical protein
VTIETHIAPAKLVIAHAAGLDTITVYFDDCAVGEKQLGQGHLTVICYGSAWTTYFSATGGASIRNFVAGCDVPYLVNRLLPNTLSIRDSKKQGQYLRKIMTAVKLAIGPAQ